jgi:hypothetical protein
VQRNQGRVNLGEAAAPILHEEKDIGQNVEQLGENDRIGDLVKEISRKGGQGGSLTKLAVGRGGDHDALLQKLAVLVKAWFQGVCESWS